MEGWGPSRKLGVCGRLEADGRGSNTLEIKVSLGRADMDFSLKE